MKITIKVKPNSPRNKIIREKDSYIVFVKAAPKKGKANKEAINLLSKYFGKRARILKGFKSREKLIEIWED